jgi:site-specific DNA recombinase
MKTYYAYIRVSTAKQGEKGSSLGEQREAITRYAQKHNLSVVEWFEERETAAKLGRTVFRRMLTALKRGRADGLIMHKVDRGARNLADWAELASLMDAGIAVHFAHEAIDLASRGGRLSADIQAVVAADFIRNLREEVKKGQQGRLKQGHYPWGAPPGYCNNGKAALKTIDPVQGPLVREAFELYAGGRFGLHTLCAHMNAKGMRNSQGRPFHVSGLAKLLANPFYYGLIVARGQSYLGAHEPLISKSLFDAGRDRAAGRLVAPARVWGRAEYRFRQLVQCGSCGQRLLAETQRGHIYYRCHNRVCRGTCVREEAIIDAVALPLSYLPMSPLLETILRAEFMAQQQKQSVCQGETRQHLVLQHSQITARLNRLTDLFIDGAIDQASYDSRKSALHNEELALKDRLEHLEQDNPAHMVEEFIEQILPLKNLAEMTDTRKFRALVANTKSNIFVTRKNVEIQWSNALFMLIDASGFLLCAHERQNNRTGNRNVAHKDASPSSKYCCCSVDRNPITLNIATFKERLRKHGQELYLTITESDPGDQYPNIPDKGGP